METIEFNITPRHLEENGTGEAKPVPQASLRAALEAARDRWLRETPQVTDGEARALSEAIASTAQVIRGAKVGTDQADLQQLRAAVAKHKAAIVKNNATKLDEHHTAALELINASIDAAVAIASSPPYEGKAVRVTLVGHYDVADDNIYTRPRVRCVPHVDIAG